MRPANIVTALSDILAGLAIAGSLISATWGFSADGPVSFGRMILEQANMNTLLPILLLLLATIGLYGGGVVLNDVFDAELDKKERPERPIPSGLISKRSAAVFGTALLLGGVLAAAFVRRDTFFSYTTLLAALIALGAVVYDRWAKHHSWLGPLNMGFCRGCNLLLGISIANYALGFYWALALVPVVYIAAITMISRGEVHGGKKTTLYVAQVLYVLVMLVILRVARSNQHFLLTLPFLGVMALLVFPPLQKAIALPEGRRIGKAVRFGVIALIAMNAAWAAAFGDLYFAIAILVLLPVSIGLARLFAVT